MGRDEALGGWSYPCRCGEAFQVRSSNLCAGMVVAGRVGLCFTSAFERLILRGGGASSEWVVVWMTGAAGGAATRRDNPCDVRRLFPARAHSSWLRKQRGEAAGCAETASD
jgi:hypothetical protein